jgi:hypothetical protein
MNLFPEDSDEQIITKPLMTQEYAELLRENESQRKFQNQHLFEQKQTITAYETELATVKKLLNLQIDETKHSAEHIMILNYEVDSLKKTVTEKQTAIHSLNRQTLQLEDKIVELENQIDQHYINKLTLTQLEQQNQQLLERIKELQSIIQEQSVENKFLHNYKHDKIIIEEQQLLKLQELEIKFPYEKLQLLTKLSQNEQLIVEQQQVIDHLEQQNNSFYQMIKVHEDLKNDQLTRAKLFEYKLLLELDMKEKEKNVIEREKSYLENNQKVLLQKSNELNKQLQSSYQSTDNLNHLYSVVIDTLEKENFMASYQTKLLSKENFLLQAEKELLNDIIAKTNDPIYQAGLLQRSGLGLSQRVSPVPKNTGFNSSRKEHKDLDNSETGENRITTSSQKKLKKNELLGSNKKLSKSLNFVGNEPNQEGHKGIRPATTSNSMKQRVNSQEQLSSPHARASPTTCSGDLFHKTNLLPETVAFKDTEEMVAFSQIKNSFMNKYLSLFNEYYQLYTSIDEEMIKMNGPQVFSGRLLLNSCGLVSEEINIVRNIYVSPRFYY